ncbi:MAG: ABC transporter substrate-binding protein [Syntrophorhabdales bacterium]|jgi:branched-chain amino acid transport system substrate-binding protein
MKKNAFLTVLGAMSLFLIFISCISAYAAQASVPSIKIGYLGPLTGPAADDGKRMLDGAQVAFDEVNREVAGRKIELFIEDDEFNPGVGVAKLKRLYYDKGIKILIGVENSAVALALRDFYHANKIPFVASMAQVASLTREKFSPYFFRAASCSNTQSAPFHAYVAYQRGYRKLVIATSDFVTGRDNAAGFKMIFERMGGKVVQQVYTPLGTMDYSSYLAKMFTQDTDGVYAFYFGADAVRFVKQYAEYGYKGKTHIISDGAMFNEGYLDAEGDAALGHESVYGYSEALDTPANREFKKAYWSKYGQGKRISVYDEMGYVSAKAVIKALQAVKGNAEDPDAFVAALEKVQFEAPRGGVFKFDKYHNPYYKHYLLRVEKIGGVLQRVVLKEYPAVAQDWFLDSEVLRQLGIK